jgi:hypothetical protein
LLRLQHIDELLRAQHSFLTDEDRCFFLREYTAGAGYAHGETNSLISNLKKPVDRRDRPEWRYKEAAIDQAARELRAAIPEATLRAATIVPIPPSKSRANPLYDDRMTRIARAMTDGDVRDLVVQPRDMAAAHVAATRPRPDDWYAAYAIDETLAVPAPTRVLLLDDVLTAGAHFAAAKRRVNERFPDAIVFGVFYARRAVQDSV